MATYSFIIRKGKYQLELNTTDKELLTEQFAVWVREAGEYARQKKAQEHRNIADNQVKAEEVVTKQRIEEQIKKTQPVKVPEAEPELPKKEAPVKEDLDIFYAPPAPENTTEILEEKPEPAQGGVFDAILDNSMKNPQTELSFKPNPSIKKDNAYINFMGSQKIEKKIDYLLLTVYYYSQYEQKSRVTLKQINSKLMQNLAVIIDHSVLQEAINRDYIECLPDLTGLVGASEYRLTSYGEKTILDA